MLEMENQKEQVYIEIKNAVRTVEANYKRIQAYTTARELAEQKLAAEEEKRRVGMSTNYVVLTYQRDLANARISELNSIISYNVSLASLEKAMGTNLKSKTSTSATTPRSRLIPPVEDPVRGGAVKAPFGRGFFSSPESGDPSRRLCSGYRSLPRAPETSVCGFPASGGSPFPHGALERHPSLPREGFPGTGEGPS